MGFLEGIPPKSVVSIDSCVLIYSVEKVPPFWPFVRELWADAIRGDITVCVSEIVLAEVLVGPLKHGDYLLANAYEEALANDIVSVQITYSILRDTARLRSETGLKTPDAIHAATALAANSAAFLTNDRSFTSVPNLPVILLSDLLNA